MVGDDKKKVDIEYGPTMRPLMESVMRTLVQQPDFRGMGGHGLEDTSPHGLHTQRSIGIGGGATVNFRALQSAPKVIVDAGGAVKFSDG